MLRPSPLLGDAARSAIASLSLAASLVLPASCATCGAPDATLCEVCLGPFLEPARAVDVGGLRVHHGPDLVGGTAAAIRALKEGDRTPVARRLRPATRTVVAAALADVGAPDDGVLLVGVPSSRRARRRRGYDVVRGLLVAADLAVVDALRWSRQPADQRRLGRRARESNAHDSLAAHARVAGRSVVVVDDVLTTGATLREAARALWAAGASAVAAAALCRTPLRRAGCGASVVKPRGL